MRIRRRLSAILAFVTLVAGACTAAEGDSTTAVSGDGCADVVDAEIRPTGDRFTIAATIRSADTGWDRYADAWEVRSPDGDVLGTRVLAHPHVDEQPFTRSLGDVEIPEGITSVEVAAHDSVVGYCGLTVTAPVPGR